MPSFKITRKKNLVYFTGVAVGETIEIPIGCTMVFQGPIFIKDCRFVYLGGMPYIFDASFVGHRVIWDFGTSKGRVEDTKFDYCWTPPVFLN